MTNPSAKGYVLHLTVSATSGRTFAQQVHLLGTVCSFRRVPRTWHTYLGALDTTALQKLNVLFEAAHIGAHAAIAVEPAPENHSGPVLPEIGDDLVAALAKQADAGRGLDVSVISRK